MIPAGPVPAVSLHDVHVRFGANVALTAVSLMVWPGECVGLVGPSGAGKSTLLRVINGMTEPTAGRAVVLGSDLTALNRRELRRLRTHIGTVHQALDLVQSIRVVHNVNAARLGQWSSVRSLWSLLRPQGVPEVAAALDRMGIAPRIFDRTDELSGGQQQRVALARILIQDPALVLADEPVSSLDPALARQAMSELCGVTKDSGRTLIISLHDPVLAMTFCDRLVGLREGQVVLDLEASAATPDLFDELYRGAR
jgi:phosphonate transport system ATP-binding protein